MSDLVEDNLILSSNCNFFPEYAPSQSHQSLLESLARKVVKSQSQNFVIKIEKIDPIQENVCMFTFLKLPFAIYDYAFRIRVDFRHKKLVIQISFFQFQNKFLKVPSPIRKALCRKLLKLNKQLCSNGFQLILNMETGCLYLYHCLEQPEKIFKSCNLIWNRIKDKINEAAKILAILNRELTEVISKQKYNRYCMGIQNQETEKMKKKGLQYAKLVRQVAMSHVKRDFKDKEEIDISPLVLAVDSYEHKLMRLISQVRNDFAFIESYKLYTQQTSKLLDFPMQDPKFDIDPKIQAQYVSYLKTTVPKNPSSGQNKFIFNQIQIVKPDLVKLSKTSKEGGQNLIYLSAILFFYCSSNQGTASQSVQLYRNQTFINDQGVKDAINPVLSRTLAIKVPKSKSKDKRNQKQDNEFNIIKIFKNGVSTYILKYYRSEQHNFEFRNCLMMDYLPNAHPLSNFIDIFKQTLSLNSKLFLIVSISNGLRFIDDYDVVHMDLNMNNIMVCKDYITKIIDFAQAFSPKVKSSQGSAFKRGYTMPFCGPEHFSRKDQFTIKQDVFSLGIIMYRMIFGEYPFFVSDQLLKSYKKKSYGKKILLAPERGEDFGDMETIDLIYRIIFRCLNEQQLLRCEPIWVTIFLKLIYYHLV